MLARFISPRETTQTKGKLVIRGAGAGSQSVVVVRIEVGRRLTAKGRLSLTCKHTHTHTHTHNTQPTTRKERRKEKGGPEIMHAPLHIPFKNRKKALGPRRPVSRKCQVLQAAPPIPIAPAYPYMQRDTDISSSPLLSLSSTWEAIRFRVTGTGRSCQSPDSSWSAAETCPKPK